MTKKMNKSDAEKKRIKSLLRFTSLAKCKINHSLSIVGSQATISFEGSHEIAKFFCCDHDLLVAELIEFSMGGLAQQDTAQQDTANPAPLKLGRPRSGMSERVRARNQLMFRLRDGGASVNELAERFDLSEATIYNAFTRRNAEANKNNGASHD